MIFNSLKSRIIFSIAGIVVVSLAITILFFGQSAKHELSDEIEGNALNLLDAKKNHVESQYRSILYHKSVMHYRRKIELKNNTTIAFAIVNSAYQKFKNGIISESSAKQQVIKDLRRLRYDDGIGYFWINDTTRPYPVMVMHPTIPQLEGNILDDPDFNCALGKKENLFKAFVDVCLKNEEGYVDYLWPKPMPEGLTEQQPKISYVKLFKPWNWIIGTGVYTDDIEKDVQDRIDAVIEDLNKTILWQRISESGYIFIFNEKNYMLVHPNIAGTDGNNLINPVTGDLILNELKKAVLNSDHSMEYLWDKPGHKGEYIYSKKAYVTFFEPLGWYICSSVYKEDFEKKITQLTRTLTLFSFLFLAIALIISFFVSRSITTPLNMLIKSISKTDKDGIPTGAIPATGITEINVLGTTMNSMVESVSKSREALWQSKTKFRGLIESSCDLIWEINAEGIYTYASPQVETMLGYKPEEIIGKAFFDLLPPEEVKRITAIFKDYVARGKSIVTWEKINLHKDGRRIVLETSGVPVFNEAGKVTGYRGMDRDITTRKETEDKLKKARSYISNIINSMPSVLVGVDQDGVVTLWNTEAERATGVTVDKAVGQTLTHVFPRMSTEMARVSEAMQMRDVRYDSKKIRQENGVTLYEDVTVYPLIANGLEGAVIRIDDITEQVRLEKMMIQSEKMLSVGGLAAGMAHEINNPLAGMMQTADVMKKRLAGVAIPANIHAAEEVGISIESVKAFMEKRGILRMLTSINESGQRIAEIVDNMLSFARQNDLSVSSNNLSELLDKTLELAATDYNLKKQYDFKTIEIVKLYEDNLPLVLCEGAKIQQVLLNILRNGAQAMQEEKDRRKKPCFILRLIHEKTTDMVRIEIEDNGPGMTDIVKKRVFEPFFTTKPVGVGTGLGLSVSYFIISENHGGTMSVESEQGMGANFIIRLPMSRA